jgi:hypothetical protein
MNLFDLPWNIGLGLGVLLVLLALREFLHARRCPPTFPDRGVGFFHAVLLSVFALLVFVGMWRLWIRAQQLNAFIPIYPAARYAPEREAFADHTQWIFVSRDSGEDIHAYYRDVAGALGYRFVSDNGTTTERLLLTRGKDDLFITIVDERRTRVLYFSESGEVRVVTTP